MYYHELTGTVEKYEGKKYLMTNDYVLDRKLDKIWKIIYIKNFDNIWLKQMINCQMILL